jgi:hypothetical protein
MKPQELIEDSNDDDARANHGGDNNGDVAAVGEACGWHVVPNDIVDGANGALAGGEHDHVGTVRPIVEFVALTTSSMFKPMSTS